MDKAELQMMQLVDRYIAGQLDDEELVRFEERLVWDEALQDDVFLAEQLRKGLRALPLEVVESQLAGGGPGPTTPSSSGPARTRPTAAAASSTSRARTSVARRA